MEPKRVVMITGCSSGIGRSLAIEYSRRGHHVVASARQPESIVELAEQGIICLKLDVTDQLSIRDCAAFLKREYGTVDVLINNAGYGAMGPLSEIPPAVLRQQFEVNTLAPIIMLQAMLPLMKSGGMVVNIGSSSAILASPFSGAYCASKAALHVFSEVLRMELGPFGVRVITVIPGVVRSSFGDNAETGLSWIRERDSVYSGIVDQIYKRARASQERPTRTECFARRLVAELEGGRPAPVIRLGYGSSGMPLLRRMLPLRLRDSLLKARFGLNRKIRPERAAKG